ncbi:MAG: sulfotransferase family 2 domain-containing protein [Flavobacteriaceae bacterium]
MNILTRYRQSKAYPFYFKKRKDIIHIHITKTAGTSLIHSSKFKKSNKSKGVKKHYFSKEIIDIINQENWDKAFKFTFVRNPWDRLYSLYRFKLRKNKILSEEQGNTFEIWLKKTIEMQQAHTYQKSKPQVDWLKDFNNTIDIDFIGRFEELESDVNKLSKILNMKIDLPHINQTLPIIHYSSAYDDELEDLVRIHYKEDIDLFNYTFERK